jgi:hypothetical protein
MSLALTLRLVKGSKLTLAELDDNFKFLEALKPRILNSTIGASYTLQESLHLAAISYVGSTAIVVTLQDDPNLMKSGFTSDHFIDGTCAVTFAYDDTKVTVKNHVTADGTITLRKASDEPSKGGCVVRYIGFDIGTLRMVYRIFGAIDYV